ncbi:exonuclease V subunit alpha [Clostridioides difficile]|nr:AAA domain-containing protein [Clostridioides difficile]MCD8746165.1 AAA domain-containing protein [Clostridioides difficile]MDS6258760.1 AAA domain-containing protein [Clostridioides difficile]CZR74694.1 superfamily I DNA helicase [Clostridium acidurici 9a] [Clostridioides difficile]CZR89290.1 exonuclease V subunit alpha [Clostridioides difficile]CZS10297.1 exonuclease V subunit alpha [Clostridioides difficile]
MDSKLTVLVDNTIKEAFKDKCKSNGNVASEEIRKFMEEYLKDSGELEYDLLDVIRKKNDTVEAISNINERIKNILKGSGSMKINGEFKIPLNKSTLAQIADDGCIKRTIKNISSTVVKKNREIYSKHVVDSKKNGESIDINNINFNDEEYIPNKLKMSKYSPKNIVPLNLYKTSGECAEVSVLYKISQDKDMKIYTELHTKDGEKEICEPKLLTIDDSEKIFNTLSEYNRSLEEIESNQNFELDEEIINHKKFKCIFSNDKEDVKNKFDKIIENIDPSYIYQMKYTINNPLEMINKIINKNCEKYNKTEIIFEAFMPDFIQVVKEDNDSKYYVLDDNFNLIKFNKDKVGLLVKDVKMSSYRSSFCTEIGIYLVTLNQFLIENKLNDKYQVIATGKIIEENLGEILEGKVESLKELEIPFENVKQNIVSMFEEKLPNIIKVINNGDIKTFNSVNMDSHCDTCDYYGGYYAGGIEYLKERKKEKGIDILFPTRISKKDWSIADMKAYFEEEDNDFCTTIERNNNSINTIPVLKSGQKKTLIQEGYNKFNTLDENNFEEACGDNVYLKADKNILLKNIDAKVEDVRYIRYGNKTANCSKIKTNTLNFYIDAKADSQNIGLCLGFGYEFIRGWNEDDKKWDAQPNLDLGNEMNLKSDGNIYTYIIDAKKYEKLRLLQFLIKINETISEYEKKINKENIENQTNRELNIAIYYWNENTISYLREIFMDTIQSIVPKGKDLDKIALKELYCRKVGKDDEDKIKKVYQRLRGFFTVDKKDQVYVVDKVLFSLQKAIQDIYVFDTNFNNTLYDIHTKLPSWKGNLQKASIRYYKLFKPYKDELHGGVFSQFKKGNKDDSERADIEDDLRNMLNTRVRMMSVVRSNIKNSFCSVNPVKLTDMNTRGVECKNFEIGNLIYLFSKLQAYSDKSKKEDIHANDLYRKEILGDSIKLDSEIIGTERQEILQEEDIPNSEEYRVYRISQNSIYANYNKDDFLLIMYPADKSEYIYKLFTNNESMKDSCIYISDSNIYKKISGKFFASRKTDQTNESLYSYKNIMNGGVNIKAFSRNASNPYIVIEANKETNEIIKYLENRSIYDFNFKENIILEYCHKDFWLQNLKNCLSEIDTNQDAINLIENLLPFIIDDEVLVKEIENINKEFDGDIEPDKVEAIANAISSKLSLLWGPPGTGKTYTIAKLILYYILKNKEKEIRIILVGGYDATYNIIDELVNKNLNTPDIVDDIKANINIKRIVSEDRDKYERKENVLDGHNNYIENINTGDSMGSISVLKKDKKYRIITCTPQQMYKFFVKGTKTTRKEKTALLEELKEDGFDFIIIDEASQMDIAHFIPAILRFGKNSQLLLAGDHKQLDPILQVRLNKAEEEIFGSILSYYIEKYVNKDERFKSLLKELKSNRRSNKIIVEAIKYIAGYSDEYKANSSNANRKISFAEKQYEDDLTYKILNPNQPISIVRYNDGKSGKINLFEVDQISSIVRDIWNKKLYVEGNIYYGLENIEPFFAKALGIVVTHTAQRVLVQNQIIKEFKSEIDELVDTKEASRKEIENIIRASVDTVDKYQGQEREIIISSFVVGETDIINSEAEFLYNPNRLNVMVSRARAKFILLVTNEMINNTPQEYERLEDQTALLRLLEYANQREILDNDVWKDKEAEIRYREF